MKKNIFALSMGAFAFGMAEFLMMSILPDVANGLNISISKAGNLIASYALGVCAGGPLLITITRNLKLHTILIILLSIFMLGSLITAVSNFYLITIIGRFVSGLPHGAFFGVAAIVANKLVPNGKGTSAVAAVMMGMTVANLLGVPLGNVIGHYISWRVLFLSNALCGLLSIYFIYKWIPELPALPSTRVREQFRFLKKLNPWLLIIITVLINTGIFSWYSYINPFMTDVTKIDVKFMPLLMVLSGGSMCIGNYLGGRLSDKFTPKTTIIYMQIVLAMALGTLYLWGSQPIVSLIMLCIAASCFFGLSAPIQQLFILNSKGGEMMGGALGQLAFNLGNAIGAIVGGIAIVRGGGIEYTAYTGVVFLVMGIIVFYIFNRRNQSDSYKISENVANDHFLIS